MQYTPPKPFHLRTPKQNKMQPAKVLVGRVVGVFLVLLILGYIAELIR